MSDGHASVNRKHLTGDVPPLFRGKEIDHSGDIGDRAKTTQRDDPEDLLLNFVGKLPRHVGGDEARRDGISRDAAAGELAGEGHGEAMEPGLGGGVVGLARVTLHARDGRDADDAAPALLGHRPDEALRPIEGRGKVGGDDVVPILLGHRHDEFVAGDAGVVDEDLDGAELGVDLLAGLGDRGGVGDVDLESLGLPALGEDVVGHGDAGLGFRDAEHGVSMRGEAFGDGLTDAATGTGDQSYPRIMRQMHRL